MPQENPRGFVFKIWKSSSSVTHFDWVTPELNQSSVWVQADHHYWFTGKPGSICTAQGWMWGAGKPSHNRGVITGLCLDSYQAADEDKRGAAESSSRNHDCNPSLAVLRSDSPATGHLAYD